MGNGSGSRDTFRNEKRVKRDVQGTMIEKFLMGYYGLPEAELRGGICRSDTERGARFTAALYNGRRKDYSRRS